MKNAKAKVATAATVVLLGGLGGLALSQGGKAPSRQVADKPVIHTKVIRRTVHVTKHAKPKHPPAAAPVEPAAGGAAASGAYVATGSSGASESAPVTTATSGSEGEAAPVTTGSSGGGSESSPVTTATSGAGGGGGEVEGSGEAGHEGGDD